uniref:TyrR/PhhR family helix-turn-helix DNA-binding protein n=1 Tax=Halorubrum lacusprofundi TaxID=2247 RepID=UPI002AA2A485
CLDGIEELAAHFVDRAARQIGCSLPRLSDVAVARLAGYHWPGNVRQLENVLFQAVSLCAGGELQAGHLRLPGVGQAPGLAGVDLDGSLGDILGEVEKRVLAALYPEHPSSRLLARRLGVSHTTIANKLKRHGIGDDG